MAGQLGNPAAGRLEIAVTSVGHLRFDDGAPVRAASGVVGFEDGWLVVSDDATHAALWTDHSVDRVRVLPPIGGLDLFEDASGTKHLKPDLEAACGVDLEGSAGAVLMGSGSLPARMRGVLLREGTRTAHVADLTVLHQRVAAALDLPIAQLNLEGAVVIEGVLRWFQRGNAHLRIPSASVDAVQDGPVADAALVLLEGRRVVALGRVPDAEPGGAAGPDKIEGLALAGVHGATLDVVAVVDADDHLAPSRALRLAVTVPGEPPGNVTGPGVS